MYSENQYKGASKVIWVTFIRKKIFILLLQEVNRDYVRKKCVAAKTGGCLIFTRRIFCVSASVIF